MSSRRGFTLIETIFSTLFIGVAVLAIVNLFPGAYLSIRRSETQLQADLVAKSVMDELRLISFTQLNDSDEFGQSEVRSGVTYLDFERTGPPFDDWVVDGTTYEVKVEIHDVPGNPAPDPYFLKGALVTVSYRIGLTQKTMIHETYLHKLIR